MNIENSNLKGFLNTGSWYLGKTTVIRVPEVLKEKLLRLTRILDSHTDYEAKFQTMIHPKGELVGYQEELETLKTEREHFIQNLKEKDDIIRVMDEQPCEPIGSERYEIATQCFLEFLTSQKLNIDDLSTARKGTKKHQLFTVYKWLDNK